MQGWLQAAWERRGLRAWLLLPLSWLYRMLWTVRLAAYRMGILSSEGVAVPVVVVGNVIAGGAGKTPVTLEMVTQLRAAGFKPGVISRGYGRTDRNIREVETDSLPELVGDEPLMLRRQGGAPVFVAARRIDAARALLQTHPHVDVLICDDGLQHLALRRDVEICVFDQRGVGNGFLLPAGPLREPWPRNTDFTLAPAGQTVAAQAFSVERSLAESAQRMDCSSIALSDLTGTPLVAVAAIANPAAFFDMLRQRGLHLAQCYALRDHDDFSGFEPALRPGQMLVCTEKDAAKVWRRYPQALAIGLQTTIDPAFFRAVVQRLAQAGPAKLSSQTKPH
jgi:tetraacyldisaccharide 4'-kinase